MFIELNIYSLYVLNIKYEIIIIKHQNRNLFWKNNPVTRMNTKFRILEFETYNFRISNSGFISHYWF